MLLLRFIFYILITINLSFSLEILRSTSTIISEQLTTSESLEKLVETYKHELYTTNSIQTAQALFAIAEHTHGHKPVDILADYYYEQQGEINLGTALYEYGASLKSTHCLFKLARLKLNSGDKMDALDHLLVGAWLSDNYCLCLLAQRILDGTFKDRPHTEAKKCLMIAAHQGFTVAITELAKYLTVTKYGQPNYLLAYRLLETISDDNRARQHLDKLKDNEVVQAYLNRDFAKLAEFYSTGHKAPKDIDLAIALIRISTLSKKDKKHRIHQIANLH
jgi:TPR repeat protein